MSAVRGYCLECGLDCRCDDRRVLVADRPELLRVQRGVSTHWEDGEGVRGCWASHVDCAIAMVERLRDERFSALRANGEMALVWCDNQDRITELRAAITEALYDYDHGDELAAVERLRVALAGAGSVVTR